MYWTTFRMARSFDGCCQSTSIITDNICQFLMERVFQIFQHFDIRPHNLSYELQVFCDQRESRHHR